MQTETGEHSGASAPGSPVTPREDTDVKPVLSTASSTADLTQDADAAPVCESTVCIPESASASVADSGHFGKDLGQSLADCLVEVNSAVASGRNTPSPCPSTSGMAVWLCVLLDVMNLSFIDLLKLPANQIVTCQVPQPVLRA